MSAVPATVPVFTTLNDGPQGDDIVAANVNTPNSEISALATLVGMFGSGKSQAYGTDLIGFMVNQDPIITKASANSLSISAGSAWICNSGQTLRFPRQNVAATTVTAANIDTGSMAVGFYYIYLCGDAVANTFTVVFSASASAPTGYTNYELYGWFYNETGGIMDVTNAYFGHVKRNKRYLPSFIQKVGATDINTSSQSFVDMAADMYIYFYTSGRPIIFNWNGFVSVSSGIAVTISLVDNGSSIYSQNTNVGTGMSWNLNVNSVLNLVAGFHTLKIQWKVSAAQTVYQYGSTSGQRVFSITEI